MRYFSNVLSWQLHLLSIDEYEAKVQTLSHWLFSYGYVKTCYKHEIAFLQSVLGQMNIKKSKAIQGYYFVTCCTVRPPHCNNYGKSVTHHISNHLDFFLWDMLAIPEYNLLLFIGISVFALLLSCQLHGWFYDCLNIQTQSVCTGQTLLLCYCYSLEYPFSFVSQHESFPLKSIGGISQEEQQCWRYIRYGDWRWY